LSRTGTSGRVSAADFKALDYTGSGHEARPPNLVRTVAPQVDAVEQPVQFIHRQLNGLVTGIRPGLEPLGLQPLEPQTETVAYLVENLHLSTAAIEEDEQHRIE
jgi:hypothetical protein